MKRLLGIIIVSLLLTSPAFSGDRIELNEGQLDLLSKLPELRGHNT